MQVNTYRVGEKKIYLLAFFWNKANTIEYEKFEDFEEKFFFFFLMKESVKQIGIALNLNLFLVQSLEQFIDSKF